MHAMSGGPCRPSAPPKHLPRAHSRVLEESEPHAGRFADGQKRADLVCGFWRQNVLELTGLLFDFSFAVHGQAIGKQPLCQPMPADNLPARSRPRGVSSTIMVPSPTETDTGFSAS